MNKLLFQKKSLRKILAQKRNLIKKNSSMEFNNNTFNDLIKCINFETIENVASFISIRSEISTNQLNKKIIELKKTLTLPVIENNSNELIFKKFNPNNNLKLGKFNIPEPEHKNRKLLRQVMNSQGFKVLSTEWWHFNACTKKYARRNYKLLIKE